MKKKILSLLLLAAISLGAFAGCDLPNGGNSAENSASENSSSGSSSTEFIDYVEQTKLDMTTDSKKLEVTVKLYVDGDTTHFNVPTSIAPDGTLKARYTAINTPESTGAIEPWGKKASNFTREKLESASSIIVETDGTEWEYDSNGRFLVWIWYKPQGGTDYRNLNLEILQNGFAYGNKMNTCRYSTACMNAFSQAKTNKLNLWSGDDPDFYKGDAKTITLKELRTNPEEYLEVKVTFEGTVTLYNSWNVYIEDYDAETGLYYGISAFLNYKEELLDILAPGNRVRMVGKVTYYEASGTYQVSDLKYRAIKPDDPDNTIKLSEDNEIAYKETSASTFNGKVAVDMETLDFQTGETVITPVEFDYAALAMNTSISMKNLTVIDAYTTKNETSNNKGAITLTCRSEDGQTITVRTAVLRHADETLVTEDEFLGKTIDVNKGFVDYYEGYQIKVFYLGAITIH